MCRSSRRGRSFLLWTPLPILVFALRFFLDTNLAEVGGERHANRASDEIKEIADEFRELIRKTGIAAPASAQLFEAVDARALSDIAGAADPEPFAMPVPQPVGQNAGEHRTP